MFAARNGELCTKDCICLYVCPTGATDTENGSIDADKCIDGCRLCVDACPSGAIYLVYNRIPKQDRPIDKLVRMLSSLLLYNAELSIQSGILSEKGEPDITTSFFAALSNSSRILAEDCVRESGHLVPDAEEMKKLINTQLLEQLSVKSQKDTGALNTLLSEIVKALGEHRDTEIEDAFVCEKCGYIGIGSPPLECPGCLGEQ